MQTRQFEIKFHTPAFLGDANQSGRWRTPPFKAQLRQWWRMAYAAEKRFMVNVKEMREVEGRLFGNAWLEGNFSKSEVRLRLNRWDEGQLKQWVSAARVHHAEKGPVDSDLYLGYGPVTLPRGSRQATLKSNAAIQFGESAVLSVAYPEDTATSLEQAFNLMNFYGTVGGRSRNGWGSYSMNSTDDIHTVAKIQFQDWIRCLNLDWPHAIGSDNSRPLIWQTPAFSDWKQLMKRLAEIKIDLRTTAFKFPHAEPDGQIHDRHWLSYPITHHKVRDWDRKNLRLPNTLRFKVRPTADAQLVGVIFHVPHQPPADFQPSIPTLERIWRQVHSQLDQTSDLQRITA
jgi:CRISPR-associated protein Cmr1